jgi:hypothetical protein
MTAVQTLVLGWDPPNSNLQIDLTHQQWAGLSNVFIFPLNTKQNLTISVDGSALTNTLSKVHAVGTDLPYWYNLNPYFDPNVNIMIGTSVNQTIAAPV